MAKSQLNVERLKKVIIVVVHLIVAISFLAALNANREFNKQVNAWATCFTSQPNHWMQSQEDKAFNACESYAHDEDQAKNQRQAYLFIGSGILILYWIGKPIAENTYRYIYSGESETSKP